MPRPKKGEKKPDPVSLEFRKITKDVVSRDAILKQDLESGDFFDKHDFTKKTNKGNNILHAILSRLKRKDGEESSDDDQDSEENDELKLLVTELVKRHPNLLAETNEDLKTPLYVAIVSANEDLINWMCRGCTGLSNALSKEVQGSSCLHAAIHLNQLSKEMIKYLVDHATEDALTMRDSKQLTPLHLAVHYTNCDENQLDIVKALVEKTDAALDDDVELPGPEHCSVWQYHHYTREVYLSQENMKRENKKIEKSREKEKAARQGATKAVGEEKGDLQGLPIDGRLDQKPPKSEAPLKHQNEPQSKIPGQVKKMDRRNSMAGPDFHSGPRSHSEDESEDIGQVLELSSQEITEYMKLYYLRTRTAGQAATWLYGKNPGDIQTMFDYFEHRNEFNVREFDLTFQHFRFDPVLSFVHLRHVRLDGKDNFHFKDKAKTRFQPIDEDQTGTDIKFFFDWLRYNKGVQRILKVEVEFGEQLLPSDEAVESCIKPFKVESLDWRRVDLCPETIFNISSNLREITLLWSGKNAVLRGWSEPEGLTQCADLETIELRCQQEPGIRARENIEKFKKRLQEQQRVSGSPAIKVKDDRYIDADWVFTQSHSEPQLPTEPEKERQRNTHAWLDCIDRFADKVSAVRLSSDQSNAEGRTITVPPGILSGRVSEDVTVAVIDDGVDIWEKSLQGKISGGKSFDGEQHYRNSISTHGTIMAKTIVRVCPTAKIYVLKVQTGLGEDSNLRIVTASAAKAIQAAVDQNVDIISMSWGVQKPKEDSQDKKAMEQALANAKKKGILMFCSAGDHGHLQDKLSYPGGFDRGIFKIGAATAAGKGRAVTPELQEVTYLLPGEDVQDRKPKGVRADSHSGSSVSTALAAGLAALVFHCVKLGAIYTSMLKANLIKTEDSSGSGSSVPLAQATIQVTGEQYRMTKEPYKAEIYMTKALNCFGLNEYNHKFIEVWKLLEQDPSLHQHWKRMSEAQRLATLAKFGGIFVAARNSP